MARCGCSGTTCSCKVTGAGLVQVTGSGSSANPYIISVEQAITVLDSSSIDFTITGTGSSGDPYVITGDATLNVGDLVDMDDSANTAGNVIAIQGDGSYALVPPATATPGAINTGNGIEGDGSGGDPLTITLAPNSGLVLDSSGLAASWTLLPQPATDRESADALVVAKGTSGTTSRISGLTTSLTNPSPSSELLVDVVQHGWAQITWNSTTQSPVMYMEPELVGGTEVESLVARVLSPQVPGSLLNIGVYESYYAYKSVRLAASETVTVYGRQWVQADLTSDTMSKAKPLTRYNVVAVYPRGYLS